MRRLVFLFFFLSGVAGLVYEVVWVRWAGTVLGNATSAVGTVLAVYLGGLGLGAWLAGRWADRQPRARLLRAYGAIEIAVGVLAPLVPFAFRAMGPVVTMLWRAAGEGPALAVAAILLVPTTLMGATLPILARWLSASPQEGAAATGRAYAVNTIGGALGAILAGFVLVPDLGLTASSLAAAALNLVVGIACVALARPLPEVRAEPVPSVPGRRWAYAVVALSGFTALVYEVAWTRALVLAYGSTVHAFTVILGAFILGLAIGGAVAARSVRAGDPLKLLAWTQLVIALLAGALYHRLGRLPVTLLPFLLKLKGSYEGIVALQAGAAGLFVLLPAIALGAVFPVACRWAQSGEAVAAPVGRVYAWNTLGTIAGSLGASFVLLPWLGLDRTILVAVAVNLVLAAGLFFGARGIARLGLALPAAGLATLAILPRWPVEVLSSGVYLYPEEYRDLVGSGVDVREYFRAKTMPRDYAWDAHGLATVHDRESGGLTLRVNGKSDASTGGTDMATQLLVGHVPLLLSADRDAGLVIGFGSGVSLGAMHRHPVARTTLAEISPAVLKLAHYFDRANGAALGDPRLRLVAGDGRSLLVHDDARYDGIASEPSNLWIRGMATLFTREAFEASRRRLAPGGVMVQWVHAYRLPLEDFRAIVRTFYAVFPHGEIWESIPGGDFLLAGRSEEAPVSWETFAGRCGEPAVREDLARFGVRDAEDVAAHIVVGAAGARAFAGEGPLVTDDRCFVEFTAPRGVYADRGPALVLGLAPYREAAQSSEFFAGMAPEIAEEVDARRRARALLARAAMAAVGEVVPALERLAGVEARHAEMPLWKIVVEGLVGEAEWISKLAWDSADYNLAGRCMAAVPPYSTRYAQARVNLARVYAVQGRREEAERELERVRALDPENEWAEQLRREMGLEELPGP